MKTFTIAELLEKLKLGQSAEMIQPVTDVIVKKTDNGLIVTKDAISTKHIGQPLPLTSIVLGAVWRLERKKINFMQAVEHLREGKKVSCEHDGRKPVICDSLDDMIHIREAVEGQWFLEE